ncbi:MAG TPA: glycosyltransferase [Streptosporangiaceae bacterium]|nr:glycosyltransferase [Streptosporangiaceae bacterium]
MPRLAALGHEVVISAPYSFGGAPLDWGGHVVEGAVRDQCGNDILGARYDFHQADLLITLCDPFGLNGCAKDLASRNVAMWFPIDCDPMGELDVTVLRDSQAIPIAMSEFGQRVLRGEGADASLRVPHGVDTVLFHPGDQADYRGPAEIGEDTFVIGICAMNRDHIRKGWHEQILAFARFHEKHPDSVLSLHTAAVNPQGLNLAGMCARLGITDAVRFPDDYAFATGLIGREQLATWYRGLDILSNCSYGEGFGIPLIEAQASGIPVVCTDASAMPELCGAGWLVSGTPFWAPGPGSWWVRPDVDDIVDAYEAAWQAKQDGTLPKLRAREFALLYEADRVLMEFWVPALAAIAGRAGL